MCLLIKLADGTSINDAMNELCHDFEYLLVDNGFSERSVVLEPACIISDVTDDEKLLFETLVSYRRNVESTIANDRKL